MCLFVFYLIFLNIYFQKLRMVDKKVVTKYLLTTKVNNLTFIKKCSNMKYLGEVYVT